MITEKQLVDSINENISSMEEGIEYLCNKEHWDKSNAERSKRGWSQLKREDYTFTRSCGKLKMNNSVICDEKVVDSFAFAFAFSFSFSLLSLAFFALSSMERKHPNTCEGKVVEIDGKKYQLKLV